MVNEIQVARYQLFINGQELTGDLFNAIESLTFEDEINLPAMFMMKMNMRNSENGTWRGSDLEVLKPGDVVTLSMGINQAEVMMTGEIVSLELNFSQQPYLEIRGYNRLHRLRFGTRRRTFRDMTDSDIAAIIAREAGLAIELDETETVQPYLFQNNQSNYDFLLERSNRIGFEVFVSDDTLIFRRSLEDAAPELTLEYGGNLESFSVEIKTPSEGNQVSVQGWDMRNGQELVSTIGNDSSVTRMYGQESGFEFSQRVFTNMPESTVLTITDQAVVDGAEAEKLARAKYKNILRNFLSGEGKCIGLPGLRAGRTVNIQGIAGRFNGVYYVISTVHTITPGEGYITTFKVKRTGI